MRRIKRNDDFEITLEITNDAFIRPPRDYQRNWVLNRLLKEVSDDLLNLHEQSQQFVPGAEATEFADRAQSELSADEIMEDWQIPIMEAMVDIVTQNRGDILEIGFGRGIASTMIQDRGPASHTIVECNQHVIRQFNEWVLRYPERAINLIRGKWQDVADQFGTYDGIFFHAYPLDADEFVEDVVKTTTFAEPFFRVASEHLQSGGIFTYLSNEYDSLSRGHQRRLFEHFERITLTRMAPINIPAESNDALWGNSIVLVKAVK
ncbi:MAG: class I SAM-dependent methyltransferase [Rhodothermia bacterium]|nr:class I SAM-dependent methyltransferase [Rhodothermia bacterium]